MPLKREKQENTPRAREEEFISEIREQKRAEEMAQGEIEQALYITNKIAEIFLTVPDDEMYGDVVELILEATKSKYGLFGYISGNSNFVIPSLTRDVWDQCKMIKKDIVYPRDTWGGIWGRALVEQKTIYTNEPLDVPEGHVPILKDLVVPIIHRGAVVGLFQVANKTTDYDKTDIRFLESLASHTAPILHARLQRDAEERERKGAEEELKKRNKEMQRFNKLAVGRELRMVELKKEINALLVQLGEEPRYKIAEEEVKKNYELRMRKGKEKGRNE
jgi:GAF domain-containing protein